MAIFGRRTTQRLIDETATVISRRQTNKLVDELNAMATTETLSPDWELILLNAFSKIGEVSHEQSFGGSTKPDLFFQCRTHQQVRFVSDIRTVSDKGIKKESNQTGAFIQVATKIYSNTSFKVHEDAYVNCLNEMIQFFPTPKVDAFNALNRVKCEYPHEGGYIAMQNQQFQGNAKRVVISARILLELLAGRMTYNEFAERYGFVSVDPFPAKGPNPFTLSLNNGALITDVGFQKGDADSDDDAVIITLNDEADPAISPFRYPPVMTTTLHGG